MSAEELVRKIEQGEIVTVNGKVICTGAMWYDRFEKELSDTRLKEILPSAELEIKRSAVLDAAKRAAGLDND